MNTKVIWLNSKGHHRTHSLGGVQSFHYALDWFRRSIIESGGRGSVLVEVQSHSTDGGGVTSTNVVGRRDVFCAAPALAIV